MEQVSFATPYLTGEVITPTELSITFDSMDELCNMMVTTTSGLDKWENTLEVTFQHSKGIKDFNYQCGVNTLPGGNYKLNCYYELMNYYTYKGTYEFKASQSLGT